MSKKETLTMVGSLPERISKYDEIVGAALINLFVNSKNNENIVIAPFNFKNEEHHFLLGVAKGLSGVVSKKVYVDVNLFRLWKINRGLDKDCRFKRARKQHKKEAINPDEVLKFLREHADLSIDDSFSFGEIYRAYYKRKKGK